MSKLLQRVTTTVGKVSGTGIIPTDDTIPQLSEGNALIELAITPQSSTSTLYVMLNTQLRSGLVQGIAVALFVDSTADALASWAITASNASYNEFMVYPVTSGSTSARTYKFRFGHVSSGTVYNYNAAADDDGGIGQLTRMTIMEVEA